MNTHAWFQTSFGSDLRREREEREVMARMRRTSGNREERRGSWIISWRGERNKTKMEWEFELEELRLKVKSRGKVKKEKEEKEEERESQRRLAIYDFLNVTSE